MYLPEIFEIGIYLDLRTGSVLVDLSKPHAVVATPNI